MCTASGAAAKKFLNLGFKSVAAYEGGIAEWHQKGLPVDGPAQESYLKIVMNKPVRVAKEEIAVTADSVEEIEEALAQETELQEQKAEAKVIEIEAEALAQKMGLSLPAQEKQEAALQEQQAEEDELIAEEMLD
jgi:3-mercaptopyruvate sulfurtransferase SseA